MPIVHYCNVPGCQGQAAPGQGYCTSHANQRERQRGLAAARGYVYRWRVRRRLFLGRYPLCGDRPLGVSPRGSACYDASPRKLSPATQVDHVVPHRGDPLLFWNELDNWQSLCAECHSRKTQHGE